MYFKPYIVLPLYLYPAPGAWKPLYDQLDRYPQVNFQVIVNPDDGPQFYPPSAYPGTNWNAVMKQLNSRSNVQTIGYVRTNWTARPITDVYHDIDAYSNWSKYAKTDLHVDGIFFDEATDEDGDDQVQYMLNVTNYARSCIASPKMPNNGTNIMLNPGTLVPDIYYDLATSVVAFEDLQTTFKAKSTNPMNRITNRNKPKSAFMINDFSGTAAQQKSLVQSIVNNNITGVWISTCNDYEKWSSLWSQLVSAVATVS